MSSLDPLNKSQPLVSRNPVTQHVYEILTAQYSPNTTPQNSDIRVVAELIAFLICHHCEPACQELDRIFVLFANGYVTVAVTVSPQMSRVILKTSQSYSLAEVAKVAGQLVHEVVQSQQ
jgi:hypothetical protein